MYSKGAQNDRDWHAAQPVHERGHFVDSGHAWQEACTVPGSGQAKLSVQDSMMCSLRLPRVEACTAQSFTQMWRWCGAAWWGPHSGYPLKKATQQAAWV